MKNPTTIPSVRISNELEREKERREKNSIYSGHLRFCLQPKGSARTPLGPKVSLPAEAGAVAERGKVKQRRIINLN